MGVIDLSALEEKPMKADEEQIVLKAELSAKAFAAINEAGNGLLVAANACEANAPTLKTAYVLVMVQAYIQDAIAAILEREGSGIIGID